MQPSAIKEHIHAWDVGEDISRQCGSWAVESQAGGSNTTINVVFLTDGRCVHSYSEGLNIEFISIGNRAVEETLILICLQNLISWFLLFLRRLWIVIQNWDYFLTVLNGCHCTCSTVIKPQSHLGNFLLFPVSNLTGARWNKQLYLQFAVGWKASESLSTWLLRALGLTTKHFG